MSSDKRDAPQPERGEEADSTFVGEENIGERSTPRKDLAAAVAVALFACAAMYYAYALPVTKNALTAPGLLPFLTSLTLLAMALGLGVKAVRRGASLADFGGIGASVRQFLAERETHRILVLMATIVVYVLAVDFSGFDLRYPTPVFVFQFSGYELISGITLTFLLKLFWGATITRCLLLGFGWSVVLASIFRYGFNILLPGLA